MTNISYPQPQWTQDRLAQQPTEQHVADQGQARPEFGGPGRADQGYRPEYRIGRIDPELSDLAPIGRAPHVDQARFWVGAVLTATVAAIAGIIGMVVAQGVLRVPVRFGPDAVVHVSTYGLMVALIALIAALIYDGLLAFAPRPTVYFGWLTGLITALTVLMPFTTSTPLTSQLVLAGTNLVVGLVVMILVPLAASSAHSRY